MNFFFHLRRMLRCVPSTLPFSVCVGHLFPLTLSLRKSEIRRCHSRYALHFCFTSATLAVKLSHCCATYSQSPSPTGCIKGACGQVRSPEAMELRLLLLAAVTVTRGRTDCPHTRSLAPWSDAASWTDGQVSKDYAAPALVESVKRLHIQRTCLTQITYL